ncbi:MAG: hypothetical protein QXT76_06270 [Sulfolobales archaeon]
MKLLDLRELSKTCSDNPMVRFLNVINRGEDLEIHLLAKKEDLPIGILKLIAAKNGYDVIEIKLEESYYTAKLRKKERM